MSFDGHTYILAQKLMSLSGDLWIEDEQGNRAFEVDGKAFRLRRTLELKDPAGAALYQISQSLAHLHKTFEIKRGDQPIATVQQAILTFLGDRFTITLAGGDVLAVKGDWIDREFRVTRAGTDVIRASRKLLSLRDRYGVQVAPDFELPLALAIVVALEQMEFQEHQ